MSPGLKICLRIALLLFLLSVQRVNVEGAGVGDDCLNDSSCDSSLICDSNGTCSTPVIDLNLDYIYSTQVRLSWTLPIDPKGIITFFLIRVFDGDTLDCIRVYSLPCSDCLRKRAPALPGGCQESSLGTQFSAKDVEGDSSHVFQQWVYSLDPLKFYKVKVYAFTDDGHGEPDERNFTTSARNPSRVTNLNFERITATSATLNWTVPTDDRGIVTYFLVQVYNGDTSDCFRVYSMKCSDCLRNLDPVLPGRCQERIEGTAFSAKDVDKDSSHVFRQRVTPLAPFKSYKVNVEAFNDGGHGWNNEKTFTTLEQRASDIEDIQVTPGRDDVALQVYLDVILTPGNVTGLTNFTVTLINDQDVSDVKTEILTGYSSTTVTFTNLLAYHNYRVTAYAETSAGRSPYENKIVTTLANKPGKARNLKIQTDSTIATKFTMTFDCPLQDERNGTVQSASVRKTSLTTSATDNLNFLVPPDCKLTLKSDDLGSFAISQNYSFSVTLENQEFISGPSETVYFFAYPKAPILIRDAYCPLVGSPPQAVQSETSIQVKVNAAGLTDRSQGEITIAGFIVCVDSEQKTCPRRTKRATKDSDYYQTYATWAQSEARDFQIPYRTTPQDWLQNNPNDLYTIGSNSKCQKGAGVQTYCNGPLPSGREIAVTAFSCTSGGCSEGNSYITKTEAPDSSDNIGLIAGITVAVVVVLLVIAVLLAVFILRRRRRKPCSKESHVLSDCPATESRSLPIRKFKETVKRYHHDSNLLFESEFEGLKALSSKMTATTEVALKDQSKDKLQGQDDYTLDNVNASFIPGFNSGKEYIVIQGPAHSTIPHFWRMVWEQKISVIVMLSDLTENNELKTIHYWPENLNKPIRYGKVVVEMTNVLQVNKHITRSFRITFGGHSRTVTQLFIPGWWDVRTSMNFGDVLEFTKIVRQSAAAPNSGPVVVQCGAGLGHAGTFIAIDYFMQYIDWHGLDADIDIFSYVLSLRKNRPRMVQAESQYIFIFDALAEAIERKLEAENEQLYENQDGSTYMNMEEDEKGNIYVNFPPRADDRLYSNQAFDSDY